MCGWWGEWGVEALEAPSVTRPATVRTRTCLLMSQNQTLQRSSIPMGAEVKQQIAHGTMAHY